MRVNNHLKMNITNHKKVRKDVGPKNSTSLSSVSSIDLDLYCSAALFTKILILPIQSTTSSTILRSFHHIPNLQAEPYWVFCIRMFGFHQHYWGLSCICVLNYLYIRKGHICTFLSKGVGNCSPNTLITACN